MRIYIFIFSVMWSYSLFSKDIAKVIQFQEFYKDKVNTELTKYLGEGIAFSSFVKITTQNYEKKTLDSFDLGYLPYPLVKDAKKNDLDIKSIDAQVFVYEKLSSKEQVDIQTLVSKTLGHSQSKVLVKVMEKRYVDRKIASVPDAPSLPVVLNESYEDKILKNLSSILSFAKYIIFAIVSIVLLFLFFKLLNLFVQKIFDGLKEVVELKKRISSDEKSDEKSDPIVVEGEESLDLDVLAEKELPSRVIEFEEFCNSNAKHIASLIFGEQSFTGFKSLMPYLGDRVIEDIRNHMHQKQIDDLIAHDGAVLIGKHDLCSWIKELLAKASLLRMSRIDALRDYLPRDIQGELAAIDINRLISLAKSSKCPIYWRIVSAFATPQVIANVISDVGDEYFQAVLDQKDLSKEVLLAKAKLLIKEVTVKEVISGEDLSDIVMKVASSVSQNMKQKDLRSVDSYVKKFSNISTEFAGILNRKVWTPCNLLAVPEKYLVKEMQELDGDKLLYVLVSMPTDVAAKLLSYIKEGKMKNIISDQLKKESETLFSNKYEEVKKEGWEFIDNVFKDYSRGVFKLEISNKKQLKAVG